MRILKVGGIAVAALMVLVAIVLAVGAMLPADHSATMSASYSQQPEAVWQAIVSYEAFPEWRSGVDRVEARTFEDGASGWVEYSRTGPLPMAVDEAVPPRRLVLRIASDDLGFGGTWTYALTRDGAGTRLAITENGTVTNLFFRFMSRFVFGHTATIDAYLVDLGTRFGEQTTPRGGG